ncbi:Putative ABC transport protein [Marinomonas sp. MED121]|uniref:glycine betaine ABC transporter substrate-binding protein n=1 Tax=Marinomonas sp. MED121 TaxID=314277 RepID=UPI00006900C3|nr:glycine betaine ABC transporter substrate-binding protein [Marinomonas sp. MED121]EAQ65563.1 Putative ABC transport protein [Marinomonas sp. MED121]
MLKIVKKLALTLALPVLAASSINASEIVIGGKNFTEQQLLTEITTQYLEIKGFDVEKRAGMGSTVLRKAQENGQVDLYWEYTGTSLLNYNKFKGKLNPNEVYQKVKELDAKKGLVWLNASSANNTYALAMRKADANKAGIQSLSDLADAVNSDADLQIAVNAEFYARDDGFKPLQKAYGFKMKRKDIKRMDSGLTYTALKEEQVDIALVFATDGRIQAFNFVTLADDKNYFPNYALTPVIRADTLAANPALEGLLNKLSGMIDDNIMRDLNARVDVLRMPIEQTAKEFLAGVGIQ